MLDGAEQKKTLWTEVINQTATFTNLSYMYIYIQINITLHTRIKAHVPPSSAPLSTSKNHIQSPPKTSPDASPLHNPQKPF